MKKVSEASMLTGVSKRTLQYYDDEGLVPVKRSGDNYRLYDQEALKRVWKILFLRELKIPLKEIRQILALSDEEQKKFMYEKARKMQECARYMKILYEDGIPEMPAEFKVSESSSLENETTMKTYLENIADWKKEHKNREEK